MTLKKLIKPIVFSLALLLAQLYLTPSKAQAQFGPQAWGGNCVHNEVATIQGLQCLVANAFSVVITIIGLAGFIMFMYSAVRLMISGGSSKDTEAAINGIKYSIIGLIVALSAFIILNLIAEFTGIDELREFTIPGS